MRFPFFRQWTWWTTLSDFWMLTQPSISRINPRWAPNLGSFSHYFFDYLFCTALSSSATPTTDGKPSGVVPQVTEALLNFVTLSCCSYWVISIAFLSRSLILCSSSPFCYWVHSVFKISTIAFFFLISPFGSFLFPFWGVVANSFYLFCINTVCPYFGEHFHNSCFKGSVWLFQHLCWDVPGSSHDD